MIEVEGLTKYYNEHAAISDLNFNIGKGEVIGFLGLNGAGKSTTLKVLGCVLLPTSGRVRIEGRDLSQDPHEIRKRIGFLPDTPPLYDEMTVGGYLEFVARLRGVPTTAVEGHVREAEQKTALSEMHEETIASLSHGYRQRVGLAQAIVHRPHLLILDEPTSGLDPVQIVEMRKLIRDLKGEHTILLSSHILSEISQMCDRLLVIHEGQIVAQGSEGELAGQFGTGRGVGVVEVDVQGDGEKALAAVRGVEGVTGAQTIKEAGGGQRDGVLCRLKIDAAPSLRPQIVRALVSAGCDVMRVDVGTWQLESIFLKLTQSKEAA
jgi:ABC-2 type transport system ATP-binding protein